MSLEIIEDDKSDDMDLQETQTGAPTSESTKEDRGDAFTPKVEAEPKPDVVISDKTGAATIDEPSDKPAGRIPKARFDEVIGQRDTLREQLAEAQRLLALKQDTAPKAEQQQTELVQAATESDLKSLRAAYRNALMEGDMEKAGALDEQIDAMVLETATNAALARFEQKQTAHEASASLQTEVKTTIDQYPYLDTPEGAEAVELIILSRDRKIASGIPAAQALREAVATIAPRFAPDGGTDPDKGLVKVPVATDTRNANALIRGAADSSQQPPTVQAGVGNRTTAGRVDVKQMSEDQFESLSPAEKKRLRGD